ncbi:MAG: NAD(P)-dependent alcohol dehydrogenase [Paracoccaceae bacterium]
MKAFVYEKYGPPDVLRCVELPTPGPGPGEVLIGVRATSVTTADWRLRASAFPGLMWVIGRLMFGLFKPRNKVLGGDVAGDVVAIGTDVESFAIGDPVFGNIGKGGYAEFAIAKADGAIVRKPESLTYVEAAALPFGALAALVFLRDFAKLSSGQRVLILGASGNVGVYAVQIAKVLGAHVTAVASGQNADLVRSLGADDFVDYEHSDPMMLDDRFDLVFDTFGAFSFVDARRILKPHGLFLPLNFGLIEALKNLIFGWARTQKMITAVNANTREYLEAVVDLLENAQLQPVVDQVFPFDQLVSAHEYVEARRRSGCVVIDLC